MAVTLVMFSTSSCGYCKPIKTMIDNMKPLYEDSDSQVVFTDVEIDTQSNGMAMAREWRVNAVPTVIIIANQEEVDRLVGDITQEKLTDVIERNL